MIYTNNLTSRNKLNLLKMRNFMKSPFLIWLIFPSNFEKALFKAHCFSNEISCSFLKLTKFRLKGDKKLLWFLKGSPLLVRVSDIYAFKNIISFCFDKGFQTTKKLDFTKVFNHMAGFVIACKFFDFMFYFNESFFFFFKQFTTLLSVNTCFFYLLLIKITMVILVSIMLIIKLFCVLLHTFFVLTLKSLNFALLYANTKSVI